MTADKEGFLERWSRLKREGAKPGAVQPGHASASDAAATAVAEPPGGDAGAEAAGEPASATRRAGAGDEKAQPLDLSTLPRIEDLTAQSDIRAFLDRRVPEALRNAALRQMWTLDPAIRDFIEVAENQWNWNIPGGAPGYELIDPATTDLGSLLAQATGAMVRPETITSRTDHEEVSEQSVAPVEGGCNSSSGPEPDHAAHNDQCAPTGLAPCEPFENAMPSHAIREAAGPVPAARDGAALQHPTERGQVVMPAAQRRHGGALPI